MMNASRVPPAAVDTAVVAAALLDAALSSGQHGGLPLGLSLLAALALAIRRRWPLLALALTLPALYIAYVLVAPVAALYTIASRLPSWRALMVCAVLTAAGYFLPWPLSDLVWHGGGGLLLDLIYTVFYVGAPIALGLLARTRRDLAFRLTELHAGHEREQQLLAEQVRSEERARLAREMHDVVSHQVSLIALQAGTLQVTSNDDGVRESADVIRRLSTRTLDELRQMIGVLRAPGATVDLAPQPLLRDIPRLVRESGQHATVTLHGVDERHWPESVERAAYRTVQEGLTNVRKHAPGAEVTIDIAAAGTNLIVTVHNGPSENAPTEMRLS